MKQSNSNSFKRLIVDKDKLRQAVAKSNQETGFVAFPGATGRMAQEYMIAIGINPEDNLFSCGIIAARDEE